MRTIALVFSAALFSEGAAAEAPAARSSRAEAPQQLPQLELEQDDTVGERDRGFSATIRPDGSVRFEPSPLALPPGFKVMGYTLLGEPDPMPLKLREAIEEDRAKQTQDNVRSDYGAAPIMVSVGGRLGGLNDFLNRRTSHQFHKRRFLSRTEPTRRRMAVNFQRETMRAELQELGTLLVEIWGDETLSLARRRERLFEVWDDMYDEPVEEATSMFSKNPGAAPPADDGSASEEDARLDDQIRELARERRTLADEARRRVEQFIRRNAPQGSPRGYSNAELRRLNARRRSAEEFRPYRRRPQ